MPVLVFTHVLHRYYYQIRSRGDTGKRHNPTASRIFSFRTAPLVVDEADPSATPIHWLFLADHGTKPKAKLTAAALAKYAALEKDVGMILHGGDMSYANGQDYLWDAWGSMMDTLTGKYPYMVVAGNHELVPGDSGNENGIPLLQRFRMPYPDLRRHPILPNSTLEGRAFWYSFDWGPVHFVAISTEHDDDPSQKLWLSKDLEAASTDPSVQWIVTFGHAPIYTSTSRHGNKTTLRSWLAPLLDKWNVDLCLWGHDHSYERLYPIQHDKVTAKSYSDVPGTVHVICGSSGWDLHDCWKDTEMSAFHTATTWGFISVRTLGSLSLKLEFIDNNNLSVADSVVLSKHSRHEPLSREHGTGEDNGSDGPGLDTQLQPAYPTGNATTATAVSSVCPSSTTSGVTSSTTNGITEHLSGSSTSPHKINANTSTRFADSATYTVATDVPGRTDESSDFATGPSNLTNPTGEPVTTGNSSQSVWLSGFGNPMYSRLAYLAWLGGGAVLVVILLTLIRCWWCPSIPKTESIAMSGTKQRLLESIEEDSDEEDSA